MSLDIFKQINNAVLDLQAAELQSYERPLRALNNLLHADELQAANAKLTEGVDLDAFITESEKTQGGMMGSASLIWPDERNQQLGLILLLIARFAHEPEGMAQFGYTFFYSGSKILSGVQNVTRQIIIPFARDYKDYVLNQGITTSKIVRPLSNKVFIVHGHDGEARETVARFLGKIGFDPIILHEQANRGRTIIEKVEANSDVSFVVVLLTPDDEGNAKGETPEPRARQNVLLELGYFIGKLGRENVCALKKGILDIPSDFAGVVWEAMDPAGGWKASLGRELEGAGHTVDWNKVMR